MFVFEKKIRDRSDGVLAYSMPQGDQRGSGWQFYDASYDGVWDGSLLSQGLGQLTDGKLGPDNYKASYYEQDRGRNCNQLNNVQRCVALANPNIQIKPKIISMIMIN